MVSGLPNIQKAQARTGMGNRIMCETLPQRRDQGCATSRAMRFILAPLATNTTPKQELHKCYSLWVHFFAGLWTNIYRVPTTCRALGMGDAAVDTAKPLPSK